MKRSSTGLLTQEGVVGEAKKGRLSQEREELQPGTPHGIPVAVLEKLLAYVTSLEDIWNLELVNKTFRNICWNSILALRLNLHVSHVQSVVTVYTGRFGIGGKQVHFHHKEKMRAGISNIWQRSVNLKKIHIDGIVIDSFMLEESFEHCEFLLGLLLYLEGLWPKKVTSFSFSGRFVQHPAIAFLISFWDQSLQCLTIECPVEYGGHYKVLADSVKRCSSLEKVALINYNCSANFLPLCQEALLVNSNLKILNVNDYKNIMIDSYYWSEERMDFMLNFLEKMAVSRNDEYFCLKMSAVQFALISKRLKATGRQLAMVTDLDLTLYSEDWQEEIEELQHISFQLCPSVKKFTIHHEAPVMIHEDVQFQAAKFPTLAIQFLQEFQSSNDGRKKFFYLNLDKEVKNASCIFSGIQRQVFLSLGLVGTVDVDRSEIVSETWDYVKNSSVKYSFGGGECVVKFA